MEISAEQNALYALAYKNLLQVATHVGLSKEDALKPGAGKWLVDYIKQMQTAVGIVKTLTMQKSPNTSIEAHESSQLPPMPPIGLLPPQG